jgi:lipopolysaccharide/colanic/teichoic acid biosynthesis glycosyltransferase
VPPNNLEPIATVASIDGGAFGIPLNRASALPSSTHGEVGLFPLGSSPRQWQRIVAFATKRLIDVVGALLGLIVLSPLLLAIALLVFLVDGSPTLFCQTRVGLHGRPFKLYKFRTMVCDAEEQLDAVRHLNERNRVAFKAANDPRITALGQWLRMTSLDELPQLWNVLAGSMSLVGPRPPLVREVVEYEAWHRRRLSMKPGITGLWQVEARADPDFDQWVARDLIYIDGWSIGLDLKILARTIPAVLKCEGR